jgi:hypothetical protein
MYNISPLFHPQISIYGLMYKAMHLVPRCAKAANSRENEGLAVFGF